MKWAFVSGALLVATAAGAQVLPTPAHHYELGIFRPAVSTVTPFSTAVLTPELVSCGHRPSDDPPDGTPNPTVFEWTDPADATMACRISAATAVLSLPIDVNYRGAVRAIGADGTPSAWVLSKNTFRRAPRGLPCPNGQPGVQVSGEADLNGKPVQISLCVNQ
jgi:hypothetical protein